VADSIGVRRVVILVLLFRCQEMHECGIMHRDLSPWNIFLSDANDVRVGDLGLGAEVQHHSTSHTSIYVYTCLWVYGRCHVKSCTSRSGERAGYPCRQGGG
jgi:serine/threonine protein kinase